MLLLLHLLLLLRVSRCTDDLTYETKTVNVGEPVKLICPRNNSVTGLKMLYWLRLVSAGFPDVLGGTFNFDYNDVNMRPRLTAKQEPQTFVLQISETELSDSGVYYCTTVDQLHMTFLRGVFLRVKGSEPDITAVIQDPLSDPVSPGDPVTLRCSVSSESDNKTCPAVPSVHWFRAGSDESHPSVIYADGNGGDGCERSPEAHPPQTCVHSFSKNVSSTDAGPYYCAVATCGQVLFGKGTKLHIKSLWVMQETSVLLVLCAALAVNLVVIAFLIHKIKKKPCDRCNET